MAEPIEPSRQSAPVFGAGAPVQPEIVPVFGSNDQAPLPPVTEENPNKSFVTAYVLSLLLGGLAVDRFYLGQIGLGIAKLAVNLLTGGLGAIWVIIDWFLLANGKLVAADDPRPLHGYEQNKGWAKTVALILAILTGLLLLIGVVGFILAIALLLSAAPTHTAP